MLDKLLSQQPTNPQVQEHMALAKRKAGNTAAARAWYRSSAQGYQETLAVGSLLDSWDIPVSRFTHARHSHARELADARPLERMSEGAAEEAGHLGDQFHPRNHLGRCLQAWAGMEAEEGDMVTSRQLFQRSMAARNLLEQAEKIQPGSPVVLQSRALLEASVKNLGAARCYFKKATVAAPLDAASWQLPHMDLRATTHHLLTPPMHSLLSLIPPQAWALLEAKAGRAYACFERQQGNLLKARSLLSLALTAQPGNAAALQLAAEVEEELGNAAAARELYVRAHRADRTVARQRRGMYESAKEGRRGEHERGAVP
ncbi:unnamed protein product [Closterium sp. NIES-65]|nr:unnamed protein product [Closterium sp. NIES-65]